MIHFKCCLNSNEEPEPEPKVAVVPMDVVCWMLDGAPCCTLINYKVALSRLPPFAVCRPQLSTRAMHNLICLPATWRMRNIVNELAADQVATRCS